VGLAFVIAVGVSLMGPARRRGRRAETALLVLGQLEVVAVGRRLERAVARIRDHDPLTAPARLVLFHHLQALGLGAAKLVDEVAEIVADVDQDPVALGEVGAARALRGSPVRLLAGHEHGVDGTAHRESELLEVLAGRRLLFGRAVGDVEHLHALPVSVLRELDGAGNRLRGHRVDVGVPGLRIETGALQGHPRLVAGVIEDRLVDVQNDRGRKRLVCARLLLRGRSPVAILQGLVEPDAGEGEGRERVRLVLDRALHPQHRIE